LQNIQSFTMQERNRQEVLPGFHKDFPYIATRAELDKYTVPWHWHPAVELFYIESGVLEYTTPGGTQIFPAGSGGFLNSNILHTSRVCPSSDATVQCLHIFDPLFLAGERGSRIEEKYILPMTASNVEIIPFFPENPQNIGILNRIRQAFLLDKNRWGYEFSLREQLATIWIQLLALAASAPKTQQNDMQIKELLVYIHEHYQEPISVQQLADAVCISKRTCYRLFQQNLHESPLEYIRSYRLQNARRLLAQTDMPITQIGYLCGLGSSSYFGKLFHREFGCTPMEYRKMARS